MEVICLQEDAFYSLIDEVVAHIKQTEPVLDEWISSEEAMVLLKISSKTTLQKYRDEGTIPFSQISRKTILYSRSGIMQYLENKISHF